MFTTVTLNCLRRKTHTRPRAYTYFNTKRDVPRTLCADGAAEKQVFVLRRFCVAAKGLTRERVVLKACRRRPTHPGGGAAGRVLFVHTMTE